MIIAFDLDDVLFPFGEGFFEWHNEIYGTNLRFEDKRNYDLGITLSCTREEALRRTTRYGGTERFRNTRPTKENIDLIKYLRTLGHKPLVVTSRTKSHGNVNLEEETHRFCGEYLGINPNDIFMTGQMDGGKTTKRMICDRERADMFIDDSLEHVTDCVNPGRIVLLYDKPWNRINLPSGINRIYRLSEIVNYLN